MSTRGTVARKTDEGFTGVYHHFDAYPSGLGRELWGQYFTNYESDLETMQKGLIDDHPAGWSTIDGDSGRCYCHSRTPESPAVLTQENARSYGSEYVYLLEDSALVILSPSHSKWLELARIPWDGNEPDWDQWDS